MNNTYILLARSLLESEVFASQKMLKVWIWCLLKANYKKKSIPIKIGRGESIVEVKRGQFLFGRFKAEEELFIDGSTIYKIMKKLEQLGNIEIESNSHYSIITINNYDSYQNPDNYKVTTDEQPSNSRVTAKEQPSNTTNKEKKDKKGIKDREANFKKELEGYGDKYNVEMLRAFFNYWSEPNKSKTKMKCEMQQTWDTAKRLATWHSRSKK